VMVQEKESSTREEGYHTFLVVIKVGGFSNILTED